MGKIIAEEDLKTIDLKNETVVTTNGTFDILHLAHVHLLQKAKALGNVLIVLLNSDSSVKRNKGPNRPIIPEKERAEMLASLSCVDYVIIFNEDKPLSLLSKIKPNIHIKGGSYIAERIREEQDLLSKWNGVLKTFELEEGLSTTNIINKIKQ